jgi:hypothetical protein
MSVEPAQEVDFRSLTRMTALTLPIERAPPDDAPTGPTARRAVADAARPSIVAG